MVRNHGERSRAHVGAKVWACLRLLIVVVVVAATVEQVRLAITVADAASVDRLWAVARLFTFFTVLSNVSLIVVLTIAGIRTFRRRESVDPRWLAVLLVSMSAAMLVTGLVYNLILRSAATDISGGWSNDVHHIIAPLFVLADVLFAPRRRALRWSAQVWGSFFPLVWVVATMLAGPWRTSFETGLAPWYPYPFLDPANEGGYGGVLIWVLAIFLVIEALLAGVIAIGRRRGRQLSRA